MTVPAGFKALMPGDRICSTLSRLAGGFRGVPERLCCPCSALLQGVLRAGCVHKGCSGAVSFQKIWAVG